MSTNYHYQMGGATQTVNVVRQGDELRVTIGATTYQVSARTAPGGRLDLTINDQRFVAYTVLEANSSAVWLAGQSWRLRRPAAEQPALSSGAAEAAGSLSTAMPGLVTAILVQEGVMVQRGAVLVILEAMKMEQRLLAPYAGRVTKVACTVGQVAYPGESLVQITP